MCEIFHSLPQYYCGTLGAALVECLTLGRGLHVFVVSIASYAVSRKRGTVGNRTTTHRCFCWNRQAWNSVWYSGRWSARSTRKCSILQCILARVVHFCINRGPDSHGEDAESKYKWPHYTVQYHYFHEPLLLHTNVTHSSKSTLREQHVALCTFNSIFFYSRVRVNV